MKVIVERQSEGQTPANKNSSFIKLLDHFHSSNMSSDEKSHRDTLAIHPSLERENREHIMLR